MSFSLSTCQPGEDGSFNASNNPPRRIAFTATAHDDPLFNQTETLRQDVDIGLAKFLSQEMAEEAKRSELSALMKQVDVLEVEVRLFLKVHYEKEPGTTCRSTHPATSLIQTSGHRCVSLFARYAWCMGLISPPQKRSSSG